jgi:hypothetical protein
VSGISQPQNLVGVVDKVVSSPDIFPKNFYSSKNFIFPEKIS